MTCLSARLLLVQRIPYQRGWVGGWVGFRSGWVGGLRINPLSDRHFQLISAVRAWQQLLLLHSLPAPSSQIQRMRERVVPATCFTAALPSGSSSQAFGDFNTPTKTKLTRSRAKAEEAQDQDIDHTVLPAKHRDFVTNTTFWS